jgi:transcriptional regulator with XRE-family HTH domain
MLNTVEADFARQLAVGIRGLRLRRGLSQVDLAARAGVNRTVIINAENGRRQIRPSTVRKIARALGVTPTELWEELRQ